MIKRVLLILAVALVAATTLTVGTPAAQADTSCSGTLGNATSVTNISGNVTVAPGASCTLIFVNVSGNVTAGAGSTLLINGYTEPSTIGGSVTATGCTSALLAGTRYRWRQCVDFVVHRRAKWFPRSRHRHSGKFLVPIQRHARKHAVLGMVGKGRRECNGIVKQRSGPARCQSRGHERNSRLRI